MQIKKNRLIARLDIKGENLIKGINLEGLRVIGSPNEYAKKYYNQGADELIFIDTVASLYGRNHLSKIIQSAAQDIFIPITVGGGIRSLEDALNVLRVGADKIALIQLLLIDQNSFQKFQTHLGVNQWYFLLRQKK